jgi:hypothetical protein
LPRQLEPVIEIHELIAIIVHPVARLRRVRMDLVVPIIAVVTGRRLALRRGVAVVVGVERLDHAAGCIVALFTHYAAVHRIRVWADGGVRRRLTHAVFASLAAVAEESVITIRCTLARGGLRSTGLAAFASVSARAGGSA